MVDAVEENEVLQNENTDKKPEIRKAKASSTPGNPAAQAGDHPVLVVIFPQILELDHHLFRP